MAKKTKKVNAIKAKKNDIVMHNGREWKVLDREFDQECSQSFYLLSNGKGKAKQQKWARSDAFAV